MAGFGVVLNFLVIFLTFVSCFHFYFFKLSFCVVVQVHTFVLVSPVYSICPAGFLMCPALSLCVIVSIHFHAKR